MFGCSFCGKKDVYEAVMRTQVTLYEMKTTKLPPFDVEEVDVFEASKVGREDEAREAIEAWFRGSLKELNLLPDSLLKRCHVVAQWVIRYCEPCRENHFRAVIRNLK
jgi:hypothetical protein